MKELCKLADAPVVASGGGRLSPIKGNYLHREKVKLVCDLDHDASGTVETVCLNGKFTYQGNFTCVKSGKFESFCLQDFGCFC